MAKKGKHFRRSNWRELSCDFRPREALEHLRLFIPGGSHAPQYWTAGQTGTIQSNLYRCFRQAWTTTKMWEDSWQDFRGRWFVLGSSWTGELKAHLVMTHSWENWTLKVYVNGVKPVKHNVVKMSSWRWRTVNAANPRLELWTRQVRGPCCSSHRQSSMSRELEDSPNYDEVGDLQARRLDSALWNILSGRWSRSCGWGWRTWTCWTGRLSRWPTGWGGWRTPSIPMHTSSSTTMSLARLKHTK